MPSDTTSVRAHSFTLRFLKKEELARDTYSFYFDRAGVAFDFIPGQYVRMTLPHDSDGRGSSRYFTIASSPKQKDILMITVKVFQSTFKEVLLNLQPGQIIQFFGPMGWFLLPEDAADEKVFIAGGIGITPFHSLLLTLADEKLARPVTLFASFSTKEEVLFYDEMQKIVQKNKQIRVVYLLTKKEDALGKLVSGRLTKTVLKKYLGDIQQPVYYIVGSPAMVEGAKNALVSFEIAEEKIRTEDFTGY
ncbi:MAG: FAD-dependent oxidoreductase [Patescibacteria group bacterium]